MIQEWFNNGCDYDKGVLLYEKFGKNKSLLRMFQQRKSVFNARKLAVELKRLKDVTAVKRNQTVEKNTPVAVTASPEKNRMASKPISHYPVALHEAYQLRTQTFYRAASLKIKLNAVPDEDDESALLLQREIWELLKVNEKCWFLLDHYDESGQVLPFRSESDFSDLSPMEVVNQRQRLYVNVSKREKTVKKLELEYEQETNEAVKERLYAKLLKKRKGLQDLKNDIDKLTKIIKNG